MCINNYNNVIKLIDWFNTHFLSLFEDDNSKHKHTHTHFEEVPKNHIIIQIDEDPDDLLILVEEIKNEKEYDYYTWDIL